jgi:hypothetical protein
MHDMNRHKCIIMARQLVQPNITRLQCCQMSEASLPRCSMIESDCRSGFDNRTGTVLQLHTVKRTGRNAEYDTIMRVIIQE